MMQQRNELTNLAKSFFLKKHGPSPATFSFIFGFFQTNNTIFTTLIWQTGTKKNIFDKVIIKNTLVTILGRAYL